MIIAEGLDHRGQIGSQDRDQEAPVEQRAAPWEQNSAVADFESAKPWNGVAFERGEANCCGALSYDEYACRSEYPRDDVGRDDRQQHREQ